MQLPKNPSPIWLAYYKLNHFAYKNPRNSFMTDISNRTVYLNLESEMLWDHDTPKLIFKYAGYGKQKIHHIYRHYLTDEQIELCTARLKKRIDKKRDFVTAGINFGTGLKSSVAQTGECMTGISFFTKMRGLRKTGGKPIVYVTMSYRATEITRRFAGDLVFVDDVITRILGPLELEAHSVRFTFASIYTSLACAYASWWQMYPDSLRCAKDESVNANYRRRVWEMRWGVGWPGEKPLVYGPRRGLWKAFEKVRKMNMPPLYVVKNGEVQLHSRAGQDGKGDPHMYDIAKEKP